MNTVIDGIWSGSQVHHVLDGRMCLILEIPRLILWLSVMRSNSLDILVMALNGLQQLGPHPVAVLLSLKLQIAVREHLPGIHLGACLAPLRLELCHLKPFRTTSSWKAG